MRLWNNPGPGKITFVLSFSMVFIFLALGYFFIGTDSWIDRFPRPSRIYIGLVLVVWAVFRGITSWMRYKQWMKEENDED